MKTPKKLILSNIIFCFLLLQTIQVAAQSTAGTKMEGKITTVKNETLPYANVILFNTSDASMAKGAITDEEGVFVMENIATGNYYVSISVIGFKTYQSEPFMLAPNEKKNFGTIQLEEENIALNAVTVTGKKALIQNKADRVVLNIENSILATGNTALDILNKSPGVSNTNGVLSLVGKTNVLILINGKQTYLSPEQLTTLLESTQSSNIKSIEIMTNPPAKYDAAGNAGIINIIMKKSENEGTNINLNLSYGQGVYRKTNGGIAMNHRNKTVNVFASYDYSDNVNFGTIDIDRFTELSGESLFFTSSSFERYRFKIHNFKIGTDINISPKSTLGFIVSGNYVTGNSKIRARNDIGSQLQQVDSTVIGSTIGRYPNEYLTFNVNYDVKLDTIGSNLNMSYDYTLSNKDESFEFGNRFLDASGTEFRDPNNFRNLTPQDATIHVGKADLSLPLNEKSKLETGLKFSSVETDNILQFDVLEMNGNYVNDATRSNQFVYKEEITAAYVNFNTQFGSYALQAGLRAERTQSNGNSITDGNEVSRTYTNLFPTLSLQKKIDENNSISASYGRRIDRPNYASLNPFVYYIDEYTFRFGNPFLNPQYTDSYTLSYTLKNKYKFDFNYSNTEDVIANIILTDPVTNSISQTDANLNGFQSYSLNVNAPIKIANWWRSYNNFTMFYNQYDSNNIEGAPVQLEQLAWQASSNHTFTIDDRSSAEFRANYISSNVYGVLNLEPFYGIDLGVNRKFLDNNMNVQLSISDILNTWGDRGVFSDQAGSNFDVVRTFDSRVIRLSLTYKFGNVKLKSTNKRGGAQEEKNRLN
ncbi:outer membrane protein beta-barrel family protein [Kordia sp. SMS9]|uniref:outer membrane beta-barrel family protein n=1 Tax=Kordia sp. SMS9 TaxID=2282170 RepID=UPI000E0D52D8|nr:outer membrane beta-barrel family protein [Kordia sp. SMS9]AXG72404.1 outer membrane protein beta-barrel family protein [Kordia sp. SMS9]